MARTNDSGDGRVAGSAAIPAPRPSASGYIHDALLYDSTDELVPGQATLALLMVEARLTTFRSVGSVVCRFRQAM